MRYFFIFICVGYIFSCFAEDPDWVKEGKRELFEKMEQMDQSQEIRQGHSRRPVCLGASVLQ